MVDLKNIFADSSFPLLISALIHILKTSPVILPCVLERGFLGEMFQKVRKKNIH